MTALELEKLKAILASKAQPTAADPSLNIPEAPAPDAGALASSPLPPPMAASDPPPATPPAPAPAVRVNPDLERAKAALAAAQAPAAKPTWQQQAANAMTGFARYGAMDPVHAQGLEQNRIQTEVENKRNKTQDLVARLKMIQDEDYRQQELERQNRLADLAAKKEAQPDYMMVPEGGTVFNKDAGKPAFTSPSTKTTPVDQQELNDWLKKNPGKGPSDYAGFKATLGKEAPVDRQEMDAWLKKNPGKDAADYGAYKATLGKTGSDERAAARNDRSFNSRSAELDKVAQPVSDSLQRLGRLFDTIDNGSPLADSVTAPELMVVMAGGAGSGVRITTAEINSIIGSQSKWEQAKAAIKQWSTNPAEANRILEPMRGQIRGLLMKVHEKQVAKEQIIEESRQKLIDSDDPKEHRQIIADTKKALAAIDEGKQQTAAPAATGGQPQTMILNGRKLTIGADGKYH